MNDLHAFTGAYAADALDDLERARFERHLAECPDCAAEVRSLREAAALLPSTVETTPPASLRASVLDEIRAVRPLPPAVPPVEAVRRRARRLPRYLAAVAAAVVLVVGGGVVLQEQRGQEPLTVAQRVEDASDARTQSIGLPDGSKLTLTHSASVGRAVLVTQDMAPAPSGKAYELWYEKDGTMVPAGLMTSSGDQTVVLHGRLAGATVVGVTVEPAGGSKRPTSPTIAAFDLSKAV